MQFFKAYQYWLSLGILCQYMNRKPLNYWCLIYISNPCIDTCTPKICKNLKFYKNKQTWGRLPCLHYGVPFQTTQRSESRINNTTVRCNWKSIVHWSFSFLDNIIFSNIFVFICSDVQILLVVNEFWAYNYPWYIWSRRMNDTRMMISYTTWIELQR